ncbi:hypothetical protein S83_055745, partial [Arachis hypogaea]
VTGCEEPCSTKCLVFNVAGTLHQQSVGAKGLKMVLKLRRNGSAASNISSVASYCVAILCLLFQSLFVAPLKRMSSLCFDEKLFFLSLYKVLISISETAPIILYIRDVERLVLQSSRLYNLIHNASLFLKI